MAENVVEEEDIVDMMDDVREFVERWKDKYSPVEVACALSNGIAVVFHACGAEAKRLIVRGMLEQARHMGSSADNAGQGLTPPRKPS